VRTGWREETSDALFPALRLSLIIRSRYSGLNRDHSARDRVKGGARFAGEMVAKMGAGWCGGAAENWRRSECEKKFAKVTKSLVEPVDTLNGHH